VAKAADKLELTKDGLGLQFIKNGALRRFEYSPRRAQGQVRPMKSGVPGHSHARRRRQIAGRLRGPLLGWAVCSAAATPGGLGGDGPSRIGPQGPVQPVASP
jgi:hypothetical protein